MDTNKTNIVKSGLGGILAGLAVGAVAGILFAPRSGEKTRKLLRDSVLSVISSTEERLTNVQKTLDEKTADVRKNVKALANLSDQEKEQDEIIDRRTALEKKIK